MIEVKLAATDQQMEKLKEWYDEVKDISHNWENIKQSAISKSSSRFLFLKYEKDHYDFSKIKLPKFMYLFSWSGDIENNNPYLTERGEALKQLYKVLVTSKSVTVRGDVYLAFKEITGE